MLLDLHVHSKYSVDSVLPVHKIIKVAQQKGLDGIAITDHNTIKGGIEAQQANYKSDFTVIIGAEILTEIGDIIGLFLSEEIRERRSSYVIEEIHNQGGIAVLPHPFKQHTLSNELLREIDIIEGANSRIDPQRNNKAIELAKQFHKPAIAGSDAHFAAEIGAARTIVQVGAGINSIQEALINTKSEIFYTQSLKYFVFLSQMIKVVKTRQFGHASKKVLSSVANRCFKADQD